MTAKVLLFLIRCYQKGISPLLGNHCRFYPTCSAYTYEAIKKHGPFRGVFLGIKRILRCHPFHPGGYDPVPPVKEPKNQTSMKATKTEILKVK